MFALDLQGADTAAYFPKGVSQAYADTGSTLAQYSFNRVQGSLYLTDKDDLAGLFRAITALKALPRLPASVHDIRAFKVEHWSDLPVSSKTDTLHHAN